MHINNRSVTVYRKHESMNERPIGIKSRYTNFHNIVLLYQTVLSIVQSEEIKLNLSLKKLEIFYCS